METITFRHQDGDLVFRIKKARFLIDANDRLTMSIVCRPERKHVWMEEPSFCIARLPLKKQLKAGATLRFRGNSEEASPGNEAEPFATVYAGEFDEPRNIRLDVKRVARDGREIDVEFTWMQPDVQYYDGRAKPNRVIGKCTARRGTLKQLWLPE